MKKELEQKDNESKKKGKTIKAVYIEPLDYFPIEIRRKYKLGEFAETKENKES